MALELPKSLIFRNLSLFDLSASLLKSFILRVCLYLIWPVPCSLRKTVSTGHLLKLSCYLFNIALPEVALAVAANQKLTDLKGQTREWDVHRAFEKFGCFCECL